MNSTLAKLSTENLAWLESVADKFDFEYWATDDSTAPWNAEEFSSVPAMKVAVANSGSHYFSPATLRFFHSKVHGGIIGRRFFITSEYMDDPAETRYSVRWFVRESDNSMMDGQGLAFQHFDTLKDARAAALVLQGITADIHAEEA